MIDVKGAKSPELLDDEGNSLDAWRVAIVFLEREEMEGREVIDDGRLNEAALALAPATADAPCAFPIDDKDVLMVQSDGSLGEVPQELTVFGLRQCMESDKVSRSVRAVKSASVKCQMSNSCLTQKMRKDKC